MVFGLRLSSFCSRRSFKDCVSRLFSQTSIKQDNHKFQRCEKLTKTSCTFDQLDSGIKSPRVIIVGAGIAGLSAAHRLHQCGIKDVIILEATNRLGGRAYTCKFEGHSVDLGAQWIRGATIANPIFNLASQERLLAIPAALVHPFRGIFINNDGTSVSDEIREKSSRIYRTLLCHVKELYSDPDETTTHIDDSIWTFMIKHIELETSEMGPAEAGAVKTVILTMMNCLKASLGADLKDVPVDRHACSRPCLGGDTYFKNGFQSVVEAMAKVIPKDDIKLSQEACTIKWANTSHEEGRVVVRTRGDNVYNGDFVIVTVSLGVMKDRHEKLFCPLLPDRKAEAIEKIAFGNINHVYLLYDKPFWIKGEGTLRVCWPADHLADADRWVRSIGLIEEAPGHPKALMFSIGGPSAICLEQLSERCIASEITNLLHQVLNEPSLPMPSKIMRSRWMSDRFFLGATSYFQRDSHLNHMAALAEGLPAFCDAPAPTLLFAGEATVPGQNGSAHGARISGVREANRIFEITKRFKGAPPKFRIDTCRT